MTNINEKLFEISMAILNEKSCLKIFTKGNSMCPIITCGNKITIKSIKIGNNMVVGDIIVWHSSSKNFVGHQIISKKYKNGESILVTKGILNLNFDLQIQQERVVGKVISIEKPNGTIIDLENRTWRIINYIIAIYSLSTGLIYQKLCSIKRTLLKNRNNRFINLTSKILRFSIFLPPTVFLNFILFAQKLKSKLKPNTA